MCRVNVVATTAHMPVVAVVQFFRSSMSSVFRKSKVSSLFCLHLCQEQNIAAGAGTEKSMTWAETAGVIANFVVLGLEFGWSSSSPGYMTTFSWYCTSLCSTNNARPTVRTGDGGLLITYFMTQKKCPHPPRALQAALPFHGTQIICFNYDWSEGLSHINIHISLVSKNHNIPGKPQTFISSVHPTADIARSKIRFVCDPFCQGALVWEMEENFDQIRGSWVVLQGWSQSQLETVNSFFGLESPGP